MCIVVDTNVLARVLEPHCKEHAKYRPVSKWILEGKGHAVFGGSKYRKEPIKAGRFMKLFRYLKDAGRAVEIRTNAVDVRENEIICMTQGSDCDDRHII
jgi:hypothetical protein